MVYKTRLPRSNEEVSQLGMGAMRIPQDKEGNVKQEEVNKMVDLMIENGVNYFDTSPVYMNKKSEAALAIALSRYPREKYNIATKLPIWNLESREHADALLKDSMERLHVDHIDFYLLHNINEEIIKKVRKFDLWSWIKEKKEQGLIRYAGFSIHGSIDLMREMFDHYDFDFAQIELNYMDFDDAPGIKGYEEIRKRGCGMIIMEPVKGGTLANLGPIGKPLHDIDPNASYASFGYRFMIDMKPNVILSGVSSVEQTLDNINTFTNGKPLTKEEHAAIEKVRDEINRLQKVRCTGCRYCMDCPHGVDIPGNFASYNTQSMFGEMYKEMGKDPVKASFYPSDKAAASNCVGCGLCKTKCPQHLDIPNILKELEEYKKNTK